MKSVLGTVKRALKSKVVWVMGGLVAVVAVGVWLSSGNDVQAEIVTDTVKRADLRQTVEAVGVLEAISRVELSFETSGTIGAVTLQEGDAVQAGEVIAVLAADELNADVARARGAVQAAQGALDAKLAGATDESVAVARAEVAVSEAALSAARIAYDNAVEGRASTAELYAVSVAEAETALTQVRADEERENAHADTDLLVVMNGNLIAVRSALSEADSILGIDNRLANDAFEDVLALTDSTSLTDATNAYERATLSRDRAEDAVFALTFTSPDAEIDAAAMLTEQALVDTTLTLLYTRRVLDATEVDTAEYSFDDLYSDKSGIDSERDNVQRQQEALENEIQSRETTEVYGRQNVEDAEHALEFTRAQQLSANVEAESAVSAAEATIVSREAAVVSAQASLAQVEAIPRTVDLASLRASVTEAQAQLSAALARLANTQLVSPIDGVLTGFDLKPGEPAVAAQTVAVVQTTESDAFQIVVDVPEADIAKISTGDVAEISFDAFGDDVTVSGSVQRVDPAEQVIEGVVYYQVTVYLNEDSTSLPLKPGMSADVTMVTDEVSDALYLPQRAVLERTDGSKYVRLPEGSAFREVEVATGLRGDEGRLQILSGVSEGDTVILTIRN